MIDGEQELKALVAGFSAALLEKDEYFLTNMQHKNLGGDDVSRYQFWEWPQGVGLFGLYNLYEKTNETKQLDFLTSFYDLRISEGLPTKNINTMAPILALSLLASKVPKPTYLKVCKEWAEWAMHDLPRTEEGGFQHITSDTVNEGELWDDTLFMTVCTLASIGSLLDEPSYHKEAMHQVRIHAKHLKDETTGLWYHGYSSLERSNFVEALWARGNCWVTIALPFLLDTLVLENEDRLYLQALLKEQALALKKYQDPSGMWHTLLDDPSSYLEASATCGFAYGLLISHSKGYLGRAYYETAMKALSPILGLIDEHGSVSQVSYGTPMGRETKDFYKQIPLVKMPYGTALAMLFLLEATYAK